MAEHLDAGDEVSVLVCNRELSTCFANYSHEASLCDICQRRCTKGLRLLPREVTVIPYPFPPAATYPEIPDVFRDFEALRGFEIGAAQVGMGAASSLCTRFNDHRFDTVAHRDEVAVEVATAYYVYLAVRHVLREVRPDRMYLFNGRFSAVLPALNACEELGIPYWTHERGGSLDLYWVVRCTMPHDLESAHREILALWAAHPEEEARRLGAKFYIDRRERVEHSWYSYTTDQRAGALPDGFDRSRTNIAIFNTTLEEFAAIPCWPKPFRVYAEEIDAVRSICTAFALDPTRQVYLRAHPNLKGCDNAQMRDLNALEGRFPNLTIVGPDSTVDSYALMEACETTVTFGSTMGVEACYWNRPSVLLARAYYESLDCAYIPATHDEVVACLRATLAPRSRTDALKYGFWDLRHGRPFRRYTPETLTRGTFEGVRIP
jgi:hypothetical protein